jgi:hypothetical protein
MTRGSMNRLAGLGQTLARHFNSSSTAFHLRDSPSGHTRLLGMTDNYDAKAIASYETYYYRHDPWAARAAKLALGAIVTSADLISDDEFVRTEFYQDWLARRVFYVLGSVFPVEGGQLGALGIHRSRADGPYGCEEKRLAEKLLPHLRRSLQLRYRLSEAGIERKAALEALDHSGDGKG